MRAVTFFVLLFLIPTVSFASDFGAFGGGGCVFPFYKSTGSADRDWGAGFEVSAGLWSQFDLDKARSLRAEFGFSGQAMSDGSSTYLLGTAQCTALFGYRLAIGKNKSARKKSPVVAMPVIGAFAGYTLLDAAYPSGGSLGDAEDLRLVIAPWDYGLTGGLVLISKKTFLEARYLHSLTDLLFGEFSETLGYGTASVRFGIRF